jgi:hypothetical protein
MIRQENQHKPFSDTACLALSRSKTTTCHRELALCNDQTRPEPWKRRRDQTQPEPSKSVMPFSELSGEPKVLYMLILRASGFSGSWCSSTCAGSNRLPFVSCNLPLNYSAAAPARWSECSLHFRALSALGELEKRRLRLRDRNITVDGILKAPHFCNSTTDLQVFALKFRRSSCVSKMSIYIGEFQRSLSTVNFSLVHLLFSRPFCQAI